MRRERGCAVKAKREEDGVKVRREGGREVSGVGLQGEEGGKSGRGDQV